MSKLEVSLFRASGYGGERGQPPARHSRFGGGAKSACQAVAHGTPKRFRVGGLAKAGSEWSRQHGRSRGFTLAMLRGRSGGFTLAEMLISVVLLAFLVLFVS